MRIVRHPEYCPESLRHGVLALGNFDGVHCGHKEILARTINIARDAGIPAAAMTFEPHPATVLRPGIPPLRITPFRQKARLIATTGIDALFVLHFTRKFSQMEAGDFIRMVLQKQLGVRHIVIGEDFHFGHGRTGNAALLAAMATECGYALTRIADIADAAERFSSSRIREELRKGDPEAASVLLGHPYILEGRVRKGEERGGTELGCPTANIPLKDEVRPRFGVYVSEAEVTDTWLPAVTHIGVNSTFGGEKAVAETHILDFNGDLYGKRLRVRPLVFLRPEEKFTSAGELKDAIAQDIRNAREYFKV